MRPGRCCRRRQLEACSGDQPLLAAAAAGGAAVAAARVRLRGRREYPHHDHLRRRVLLLLRDGVLGVQQLHLLPAAHAHLAAAGGGEVLHHPRAIITALKEKENVSVINVMYVSLEIQYSIIPKEGLALKRVVLQGRYFPDLEPNHRAFKSRYSPRIPNFVLQREMKGYLSWNILSGTKSPPRTW